MDVKRVIGAYRKTDHCMMRQQERNISDALLLKVFELADFRAKKRWMLIVSATYLRQTLKIDALKGQNEALVIRLSKKCIKTCYFCKDPEYLYKEHPTFEFVTID